MWGSPGSPVLTREYKELCASYVYLFTWARSLAELVAGYIATEARICLELPGTLVA